MAGSDMKVAIAAGVVSSLSHVAAEKRYDHMPPPLYSPAPALLLSACFLTTCLIDDSLDSSTMPLCACGQCGDETHGNIDS